jgi:hypothetical protein
MAGYPTLYEKHLETPEHKHEFHATLHNFLKGMDKTKKSHEHDGEHFVEFETLAFSAQKPRPIRIEHGYC